jgi:hypothetical protein
MSRNLVEHVLEKRDPCLKFPIPNPVDIYTDFDIGLVGFSLNTSSAFVCHFLDILNWFTMERTLTGRAPFDK